MRGVGRWMHPRDGSRLRGEGAPRPREWHEREILDRVWSSTSCFKTVCFNVCNILYFFSSIFFCIVPYKYVFNFSLLRCYLYNFGIDDWCWNNDFSFPPNSFTKMQVKREQNRIELNQGCWKVWTFPNRLWHGYFLQILRNSLKCRADEIFFALCQWI